jgi:mannose-6-phosphate isomerase-like protein (cupin superfamily)
MTADTTVHVEPTPRARVVRATDGDARWIFDSLVVTKVAAADTHGGLAIHEATDPPSSHRRPFVGRRVDVVYLLLEGEARLEVDGEHVDLSPGDLAVAPRGVAQGYTTGVHGCRWLLMFAPGIPADAMGALSRPAERRSLPPDAGPPIDRDELLAIWRDLGFEPVDTAPGNGRAGPGT